MRLFNKNILIAMGLFALSFPGYSATSNQILVDAKKVGIGVYGNTVTFYLSGKTLSEAFNSFLVGCNDEAVSNIYFDSLTQLNVGAMVATILTAQATNGSIFLAYNDQGTGAYAGRCMINSVQTGAQAF